MSTVVLVGPNGQTAGEITASLKGVETPRLSPDGRSLAVVVEGDVWRYDLDGRPPIRLTSDGNKYFPVGGGHLSPLWTPDGSRVVYEIGRGEPLAFTPADGGGGPPEPASPPGHFHPHAWSSAGDIVALRWPSQGQTHDLVRFEPRADGRIQTILATPAREGDSASISPDARWLAYTSESSGREEIWVRPFSQPGAAIRVSANGGSEPVWARDGRTLYFLERSAMMIVAVPPVPPGALFTFEPPKRLFETTAYRLSEQPPSYDVTPDGRFVMLKGGETPVTVVFNWVEQWRRRATR